MSLHSDKSFEVEQLDNGWVLTWSDETLSDRFAEMTSMYPPRKQPKTRGREIFTDRKKLMKRIEELI